MRDSYVIVTVLLLLIIQESQMKVSKLKRSNSQSMTEHENRGKAGLRLRTRRKGGTLEKLSSSESFTSRNLKLETKPFVSSTIEIDKWRNLSNNDQRAEGRVGHVGEIYPGIKDYEEFGLKRRILEKEKRRELFLREASSNIRDKVIDRRTLFVGNLPIGPPLHRIRSALLRVFKHYGKIESMRFRSFAVPNAKILKREALKRYQFGMQKGNMNAYIVFFDENSARCAAQGCNGMNLTITYNRSALLPAIQNDSSKISRGVQQRILENSSCVIRCDTATGATYVSARSIFLGNVPFTNASEDSIRLLFHSCGEIENVRLIRDKATGFGKGFGYVQFVNESSVKTALQMAKSRPPTLLIGHKSYELRIQAAMKPLHLQRKNKLKRFLGQGGKKGLKKRMKRWKARKKKRFEIKSGIRKPNNTERSSRSNTKLHKTEKKRNSIRESRNTKLANKGQVKVQKEKKATKDIKRRKGRKIERGKK